MIGPFAYTAHAEIFPWLEMVMLWRQNKRTRQRGEIDERVRKRER